MMVLRSYGDFADVFSSETPDGVLTTAERALYDAFKISKRRREWLLGRLAAKDAASRLLRTNHGLIVALDHVEILPDEDQVPTIKVIGDQAKSAPQLVCSLSHRGEFAAAAVEVEQPGRSIGVDIDRVEPREDSFLRDYFSKREQKAILCERPLEQDRQLTAFWCLKEAALKALKKGLSVKTNTVEVVEIQAEGAVQVRCDPKLSSGHVTARCWHLPSYVLAWAAIDATAEASAPDPPYPARVWAPETATPDAELPAPVLKVVGS